MITVDQAKGTPWTEGWHNLKVVRRVDDGAMNVCFDDMEKPLMTARDKTFTWGQVGLGTFDDHGNFDDFELHGVRVEKTRLMRFPAAQGLSHRRAGHDLPHRH